MHTFFALLCFVVVIHWLIFPYPSGLLHWHCGNLTIAPVPAKQPWWIWINTSCEFIMNDCMTTTKQSTTKPCAYFLGNTVTVTTMFCFIGLGNGLFVYMFASEATRKTGLLDRTKYRQAFIYLDQFWPSSQTHRHVTRCHWLDRSESAYTLLSYMNTRNYHMCQPLCPAVIWHIDSWHWPMKTRIVGPFAPKPPSSALCSLCKVTCSYNTAHPVSAGFPQAACKL